MTTWKAFCRNKAEDSIVPRAARSNIQDRRCQKLEDCQSRRQRCIHRKGFSSFMGTNSDC
jgi:hypothetical protein